MQRGFLWVFDDWCLHVCIRWVLLVTPPPPHHLYFKHSQKKLLYSKWKQKLLVKKPKVISNFVQNRNLTTALSKWRQEKTMMSKFKNNISKILKWNQCSKVETKVRIKGRQWPTMRICKLSYWKNFFFCLFCVIKLQICFQLFPSKFIS